MRCQCLGDFDQPAISSQILDMYCRDEPYSVMKSGRIVYPGTADYVDLVVANKTRCGSYDPVDLKEENKCHCTGKDEKGASKNDGVDQIDLRTKLEALICSYPTDPLTILEPRYPLINKVH